jgi:arylsulfatase
MITRMDRSVGRVTDLLRELGLEKDTLVVFTSDNGPTYNRLGGSDSAFFQSAGPFRGFKGDVYEGGIRVPLIASWPGRIKPGTSSEHVGAFWDVLPTLCEVSGAAVPADTDGISFLPTLLGKGEQRRHPYLYWEFPAYTGQQAVRMGPWKAVRRNLRQGPSPIQLYNLAEDIAESKDVAAEHPEVITRVRQVLAESHTPSPLFRIRGIDGPPQP